MKIRIKNCIIPLHGMTTNCQPFLPVRKERQPRDKRHFTGYKSTLDHVNSIMQQISTGFFPGLKDNGLLNTLGLKQFENGHQFAGDIFTCIFFKGNDCNFIKLSLLLGVWWTIVTFGSVNSLRPSDAYMRRWTGSSLLQIMACRLFGAKPLSEPMLEYC